MDGGGAGREIAFTCYVVDPVGDAPRVAVGMACRPHRPASSKSVPMAGCDSARHPFVHRRVDLHCPARTGGNREQPVEPSAWCPNTMGQYLWLLGRRLRHGAVYLPLHFFTRHQRARNHKPGDRGDRALARRKSGGRTAPGHLAYAASQHSRRWLIGVSLCLERLWLALAAARPCLHDRDLSSTQHAVRSGSGLHAFVRPRCAHDSRCSSDSEPCSDTAPTPPSPALHGWHVPCFWDGGVGPHVSSPLPSSGSRFSCRWRCL